MKKILLLLLISSISFAQNANRKFINFKESSNTLQINTSDGQYLIKSYSEKIIETSFIPNGETFNPVSHAVVLISKAGISKTTETPTAIQYSTAGITTTIQKSPFKITYSYKTKELLSEKNGYIKKDSTEILDFNLDPTETLYGGGARAIGMNRRGNRLKLYNRAQYGYETRAELMNFTMPLVMSSKIYAIHFDNAPIGFLDLDSAKNNTLAYETISGRKTYQVIAADSWLDLITSYTDLTGKQPLPPRWALGNFSSRFGYHNEEEVRKTIDRFIKDEIPVDAIILDLYWFGKTIQGTMGNLDWDKDTFPNPVKMISDLNDKGVKTILITEPFILTTSTKWQEAVDKKILATDKAGNPFKYDFYFGNTGLIDIFKPQAKDWFWDIYKKLINQGVAGMWGDLGEPEVHPTKLQHAVGSADEVHNIYGHNWAKLVADGYKKDFPEQRPFILMRSGYSGSQRFGMIPWSGDVSRTWGGLQSQTEIALQMGMQGMGYMHSDLGGFAGDYFDNELYIRWLQYGVFQPIFRPHAQQEVASEPVYKDVDTKAKAKKQIELRYQMLPYNYTLAFENATNGIPLMRPLFFEEPDNKLLQSKSDEYLWGSNILVVPIVERGLKEKAVYFPKSANWFDFYTGEKFTGGKTYTIKTKEENIPTFARGGSLIPMTKIIQNTGKYNSNELVLHYFLDEASKEDYIGYLYDDDGKTPDAFKKDNYELTDFIGKNDKATVNINVYSGKGKNFQSADKKLTFIVYDFQKKPTKVLCNNQMTAFNYDPKSKQLTFEVVHTKNSNSTTYKNIPYEKSTFISIIKDIKK